MEGIEDVMPRVPFMTSQFHHLINGQREIEIHFNETVSRSKIPTKGTPRLVPHKPKIDRFTVRERYVHHGPLPTGSQCGGHHRPETLWGDEEALVVGGIPFGG
jgi:hypothetical protein